MSKSEEVLAKWELKIGVCSMAQERVASGGWSEPISWTPENYLAWIEDEARIQEDRCGISPENAQTQYARHLRQAAEELRTIGVTPASLPWEAIHCATEAEGRAFLNALQS